MGAPFNLPRTLELSPQLRTSLDVIRALAALYVVLHHVALGLVPDFLAPFLRFGQEAVMTFFLLSGFVIHANERHRVKVDVRGYLLRRGLRIYPTLLCAMAVSAAVALSQGEFAQKFKIDEAFCTLFALQDISALKPGTICHPFMGNSPLWSLSYEVIFYLLYPFILRVFLIRPRLTQHSVGFSTLVLVLVLVLGYGMFPAHFFLLPSYFLIWWCGAMMAERFLNFEALRDTMRWPMAYLGAVTVAWSILVLTVSVDQFGTYPVLMLRHFGVSFVLLALALSPFGGWIVTRLGNSNPSVWGYASGISYGIYVLHYPLLIQWHLSESWGGLVVAIAVLLVLSELGDRRMNKFMRRLLKRPKAVAQTHLIDPS